jgi:NADPH2:quinone reductase
MEEQMNHVIVVKRRGGPEVLEVASRELPEPGPGEARVKVLAAGVSGFDVMLRSRRFPGFTRLPYTPGEDVVGLVDKLGDGVTALTVGQRVAGWTFGDGGCYAEFICTPADRLVPVPADLDSAEAVTLVVNYLTAAMAMHETAKVQSGERILVHGAAGGVGSALIQLGAMAGLEMYGTASRHNHELVSAFGATPIDYRADDFVKRIRTLTGDGVDVVFDPVGGARQLLRSYRCLRKGGRLVMLGMAAASKAGTRIIPTSLLTVGALKLVPDGRRMPLAPGMENVRTTHGDWYRTTLTELLDNGAAGKLKPVVALRVPLLEAAKAHEIIARGGHAGKVVLIANE